jgi:hypothetical protein
VGWQKKGSSFEGNFSRTHDITIKKSTIDGFYGRAKFLTSQVLLEILKIGRSICIFIFRFDA